MNTFEGFSVREPVGFSTLPPSVSKRSLQPGTTIGGSEGAKEPRSGGFSMPRSGIFPKVKPRSSIDVMRADDRRSDCCEISTEDGIEGSNVDYVKLEYEKWRQKRREEWSKYKEDFANSDLQNKFQEITGLSDDIVKYGRFAKESLRDSRLGSFGTPTEPPGGAKRRFSIDSPLGSASEACNLEPPTVVLRLSTENTLNFGKIFRRFRTPIINSFFLKTYD